MGWRGSTQGVPKPPPHPRVEARRPRRQLRWRGTWRGKLPWTPAGAGGEETLVDDDDDDEPAEVAVCAFVAKNLSAGSKPGNWKPLQQGWRKQEKRDPRRIGDPPLSFGEFIRAHPQGCFVCYGRKRGFNHDHRTCPIHKATRRLTRRRTGRRSVRPRVSGKPRWKWTGTSSPSWCRRGSSWPRRPRRSRGTGSPGRTTRTRRTTRTTRTRTRTRNLLVVRGGRRASTTLRPRRTPPLPQPTPPSGAPAAKGPS